VVHEDREWRYVSVSLLNERLPSSERKECCGVVLLLVVGEGTRIMELKIPIDLR
jgi:hypothetical protein